MKTYHIITFGCQANAADSERIAGMLESIGYAMADKKENADLIVINGCSVRQSAIDRLYAKINQCKSASAVKKIILAGCILESDKKKLKDKVNEIWRPDEYFDFAPIYSNPRSAQVPIMTGCDNFCSYCAVPYVRGRERSRPAKDIVNEIKRLIKKNYKEIWLLGQNVNSYPKFPDLLKRIDSIPGDFLIRFLSPHPKDMSDELIEIIANSKKIAKEIHLPVQSGDDIILKKMNRGYTVAQYKNLIKKIRQKIPKIKISTDIIVGFPSETKKQFQNTVKLTKEIGFKKAYIGKYSPRPETLAAKMNDNVSREEKKRRWKVLNEIINQK